jgi:uncharacterized membrane protein YhaH (DUF805 family)
MPAFFASNGRLGRGLFAFRAIITIAIWAGLALGALHYVGYAWPKEYQLAEFRADQDKTPEKPAPGAPAKPQPDYRLAGFDRTALGAVSVFIAIVVSIFGSAVLLIQVINRLRDLGWPGWYCLIMLLPLIDVLLLQRGYDGVWCGIAATPTVMFIGALLFLPGRGGVSEDEEETEHAGAH